MNLNCLILGAALFLFPCLGSGQAADPDGVVGIETPRLTHELPPENPSKKIGSTIAALEKEVQDDPRDFDAWFHLGLAYDNAGEWVKAENCFKKAGDIDPANFKVWNNLGIIYMQENRLDESEALFQKVLKDHPQSLPALINLSELYVRRKKLDEADRLMKKMVDMFPYRVGVWITQGDICSIRNDWKGAYAAYYHALEIDPDNTVVLHNRGVSLYMQGKKMEALKDWQRVTAIDPGNASQTWRCLSIVLAELGRKDEADAAAQKYAQSRPDDPPIVQGVTDEELKKKIQTCLAHRQYDELELLAARAVKDHPDDERNWYLLLESQLMQNKFDAAHDSALRGLAKIPVSGTIWMELGKIQIKLKEPDKAIVSFQHASELVPDDTEIWNCLGAAHAVTGKTREAIGYYKKALECDPKNQIALANLAKSYAATGDTAKARETCDALADVNGRMADALRAQLKLSDKK